MIQVLLIAANENKAFPLASAPKNHPKVTNQKQPLVEASGLQVLRCSMLEGLGFNPLK